MKCMDFGKNISVVIINSLFSTHNKIELNKITIAKIESEYKRGSH